MDSGISGNSMQSSSCGDEELELDSRVDQSITTFLNSSNHVDNQNSSPNQNYSTGLFDPLSGHFDPFSVYTPQNSSSFLNQDMGVWPRSIRTEGYSANMGNLMNPSSCSNQAFSGFQETAQVQLQNSSSASPLRGPEQNSPRPSVSASQTNVARISKKRTRASRKAPTTVLTTDTSNFRAMVQEFTGIPTPSFTASPFTRTPLDLLNASSSSNMNAGNLSLLRPFAQKYSSVPPFLSYSSMNNNFSNTSISNTSSNLVSNYNDYHQLLQSQNLLNMQNQLHTFQSIIQPSPPNYSSLSLGNSSASSAQVRIANQLADTNQGSVRPDMGCIGRNESNQGSRQEILFDGASFDGSQQWENDINMRNLGSSSDINAEKG